MTLSIPSKKQSSLFIISMALSFCFCHFTYGQPTKTLPKPFTPPCSLELKDSPTIRGIRLGMPVGEFLKMFPSATEQPYSRPEVGAITYEIDSEEEPNFAGSGVILNYVWFIDGKLSSAGFKYPEYEPVSISNFIRQAAVKLNLPSVGWRNYDGSTDPEIPKVLKCKDFDVTVGQERFRGGVGVPYLSLSDYSGDAKIMAREKENKRKEIEDRLRKKREKRIFKP